MSESHESFEGKSRIENTPQSQADSSSLLESGEIRSIKELEGYWGMHLVGIKDGDDAFFRPDKETAFIFESTGKDARRSDLEVVAFKIDKTLGFGLVPPVVYRTVNGTEGSLQKFIKDSPIAKQLKWRGTVKPEELTKAAVFDYLLDVKDRRGDNFLVNQASGKIWLIDHDYWMFWNEILRSDILQETQTRGLNHITPETQSALERFITSIDPLIIGAKSEVVKIVKKAQERAKLILDKGKIPS